ncbi:peptide ABC transporter substrate-binding protein [Salinicola sp. JS01]|uniref:peptide ABC transporter substrate-binding protein n=1 Tax=Salinicola sp. JS01 TaxID=3050071 RepID=UPI00255C0A6D|nr:peptide ABC transporter substrate-binding protein [Salinicola sp. JS01]WIX32073.1 peptide ABC transporter substrate-binding protein [Salinicola sp. JS01]
MLSRQLIAALGGLALGALATSAQAFSVNIANGAEPGTLDPQKTSGTWETRITRALFEGLVTYAADGSLVPGLAERWEISADGKTYTFHLRDAEWSDGEPITAEDAAFALRRVLEPAIANHNANLYYPIVGARAINAGEAAPASLGVETPDAHTLKIHLTQPTAWFLQALAMTEAAPLPAHAIEAAGEHWVEPGKTVSSGAFTLSEWQPQARIVIAKNPHFHAAQNVALDQAIFYPIDDAGSALNRFRTGEMDIAYSSVPSSRFAWAKRNLADALRVGPLTAEYFYMFNLRDGQPLADRRVREALNLAVRREVITGQILGQGQTPSTWFVPRGTANAPGGQMAFADMSMEDRLTRARQLMKAAGYGPEHPLRLTLNYNTLEDHKKIAVAVAAMWKPLGVEVALVNSEAAVHYATIRQGKFEVARYGMVATINDPFDFLGSYADDGSASRASGYHDAEYDALVARSTGELDPATRQRTLTQAQQRLLDDYALLPLYDYVSVHLVSPKLDGWQSNPMDVHPLRYLEERD